MNKTALILCFLAFAAYGQQKLVAIINTVDDEEPPLKISELNHLTDRLREIAAKTLPPRNYAVMTSQSILSLFASPEDMIGKCNELSGCLVKIGREIAADYIGQGRIGRFGKNLTIKVELYETRRGTLVSSFTGSSKDIYGLLSVLDEKAPDLFKRMSDVLTNPSIENNVGILQIKSAYSYGIGRNKEWDLTINDKIMHSLENRLSPGKYKVKLAHKCYENINFEVGIKKGRREIYDMAKHVYLKQGGLSLSAELDNVPISEPVFVNSKQVGETPFEGLVPLCSEVQIGSDVVNVKLKHNENVAYNHIMYSQDDSYEDYYSDFVKLSSSENSDALGPLLAVVGGALLLIAFTSEEYTYRNELYLAGGLLFATGIGVYIWF